MTEIFRERYTHDVGCDQKTFTEVNERGLKTCLDCSGVFDDKTGEGVFITDRRFDENYDEWKAAEHPDETA